MDTAGSRHGPESGASQYDAAHYEREVALEDEVDISMMQRKENCDDNEKSFY